MPTFKSRRTGEDLREHPAIKQASAVTDEPVPRQSVGIAFLTKDRCNLTRQTIRPLLGNSQNFALHWVDGSTTDEGKALPGATAMEQPERHRIYIHAGIRGGPDAAVAFALTRLLDGGYDYIGLVENDVLLPEGWFTPTFELFEWGQLAGLEVGAVSARAYEDRILIQRYGYAVMHNLGWGMQIMTRKAARLALTHMRTSITTENRRLFAQIAGVDIGKWWAFGTGQHMMCADWGNDRILAAHGLASLALVPSPVEMIGQVPPLAEQGLTIAAKPIELLRDDVRFSCYADTTAMIHYRTFMTGVDAVMHEPGAGFTFFPHQMGMLGVEDKYAGAWKLGFCQGFGPFTWVAERLVNFGIDLTTHDGKLPYPTLTVSLQGPVSFLVSNGRFLLTDEATGYEISPDVSPQQGVVSLPVPDCILHRRLVLTALTPGATFHGIRARDPQPINPTYQFDWKDLPKP